MTEELVRVLIPVVPTRDSQDAVLREFRFRTQDDDRGTALQLFFSDEPQKGVFRDVANRLKAEEANSRLGQVPRRFGDCVQVTVPQQLAASGTSSMLGAAAGFIAARAAEPARLPRLAATGALEWPRSAEAHQPLGDRIAVQPVAGLARKLAAILAAPQPSGGLVVAVPQDNHPDDVADTAAIDEALEKLRQRGDTVLRAGRLGQVFAAWLPADAWATPGLAAQYAGAALPQTPPPKQPVGTARWRWTVPAGFAVLLATVGVVTLPDWSSTRPAKTAPAQLLTGGAVRLLDAPDTACFTEASLRDAGSGPPAAVEACRAVRRCDSLAGHPLDPDRRALGLGVGVGAATLQAPALWAPALTACTDALRLAPNSAKSAWHLSRVEESRGERTRAAALREQAAAKGEPMARLRLAQDLMAAGEAVP
ncbi:MAG: hypothetical protein ACOYOH_28625, partial [Paracraurococcus sp.]